ncbi:MAG: 1-deoxy-D-xylulose-5-phosphate reductoisomerase, partial [Treponema sp.]|nr:1-deoxy-D-xylulose-5-phosphate reductoisomerase [Treponema sp.]
ILGATGSIGKSALSIIKNMQKDFSCCGLVANKSKEQIQNLAREFNCPYALTSQVKNAIQNIIEKTKPDLVLNGIAGSSGLLPSKIVLENKIDLALANKESVVMAHHLLKDCAKKNGAKIIPVDSEHSAIFNLLAQIGKENVSEIIITASGGPFRNYTSEQLQNVKVKDALNHPTWNMGAKITIDSATLANKGLEVIEAVKLFDFTPDKVKVVLHPESIVHSFVRTHDGMLYAQLSEPNMEHPIFSAFTYPENKSFYLKPFNLFDKTLSFYEPDTKRFPLLSYAYNAATLGASYPIAYNASNEIAVSSFLEEKITFTQIAEITESVLQSDWTFKASTFEEVFEIDKNARAMAKTFLEKIL